MEATIYGWKLDLYFMYGNLICPSFDIQRRDLLASISVVLRPFAQINCLSHSVLLQPLFYGDKDLPNDVNKHVLQLTLNFIHQTGRFA